MPTITAVIPTYNEEKYLGHLLRDLSKQTDRVETVIVADCDSKDKTLQVAKSSTLKLKVVRSGIRTPSAARNVGARAVRTDYVLFLDTDMRLPKNFVADIRKSLTELPVDVLTPGFVSDGKNAANGLLMFLVGVAMFLHLRLLRRVYVIGGVICVRKSVHDAAGGFDDHMAHQNDIDYAKRLRGVHASYTYLRDLKAVCSSRRYANKSFARGVAQLWAENSPFSLWLFQPLLRKVGKGRRYGHFN